MAPLCGKPLSPKDRKVWRQAIAMLMGLKIRNDFGENDLAAAVGKALHRGKEPRRTCEDCRKKVARGAASSRGPQEWGEQSWRFLNPAGAHFAHPISCKPPTFPPPIGRES
jgi:hypothetical protein